jgi:hypothetical protein
MTAHPLCLSRSQLAIVHDHAARVLPPWRHRFLTAVGDELTVVDRFDTVDDGTVQTVCRRVLARMVPTRGRVA